MPRSQSSCSVIINVSIAKNGIGQTLNQLLNNYPNQIRFVYRDFPLSSIHPAATAAAEAANCAGDQNKYWEFFQELFSSTETH